MLISRNKQEFLTNEYFRKSSYGLSVTDLRYVAIHYLKKHRIQIFINGDTPLGQSFIAENMKTRRTASDEVGLNKLQVRQEIVAIQKLLGENEAVGYLFTEGKLSDISYPIHVESLIITKEKVIKPVHWNSVRECRKIKYDDINDLYVSDWLYGQPHTSTSECASFSLLYLKELLKDEAKQLKEYSLCFPCYSDTFDIFSESLLCHFFIPSPQVLRYSQSNTYNIHIELLFRKENLEEKMEVQTLTKILERSIKIAKEKNDDVTVKSNTLLLQNLPDFLVRWSKEYLQIKTKRSLMDDEDGINRYLVYRAKKLQDLEKQHKREEKIKNDLIIQKRISFHSSIYPLFLQKNMSITTKMESGPSEQLDQEHDKYCNLSGSVYKHRLSR